MSRILGIETSCDETGVALVEDSRVVAARVATQEVHARWGGVVPELASRLHQRTLARMVAEILDDTGWGYDSLDGVGATRGPGLIGALLVGVSYAKGIAVARDIPFCGVNHLEGHLWAVQAEGGRLLTPALALLVSGGHTELVRIEGFGKYRYLGATLDDAAGEAFDKVGGLLGIPYPAGAELSELAKDGNPGRFSLPIANPATPFDFSFSGLKTASLRLLKRLQTEEEDSRWRADFAAAFEQAVVMQLIIRLERALENDHYRSLLLSGGVAANETLRRRAARLAQRHGVEFLAPSTANCTDNGAMIAYLASEILAQRGSDPLSLPADPNLTLVEDRE